jgi:hypothetical protein
MHFCATLGRALGFYPERGIMTRKERATLFIRIAIALLIVTLGVLIIAASVMARTYGRHDREDDARLTPPRLNIVTLTF